MLDQRNRDIERHLEILNNVCTEHRPVGFLFHDNG